MQRLFVTELPAMPTTVPLNLDRKVDRKPDGAVERSVAVSASGETRPLESNASSPHAAPHSSSQEITRVSVAGGPVAGAGGSPPENDSTAGTLRDETMTAVAVAVAVAIDGTPAARPTVPAAPAKGVGAHRSRRPADVAARLAAAITQRAPRSPAPRSPAPRSPAPRSPAPRSPARQSPARPSDTPASTSAPVYVSDVASPPRTAGAGTGRWLVRLAAITAVAIVAGAGAVRTLRRTAGPSAATEGSVPHEAPVPVTTAPASPAAGAVGAPSTSLEVAPPPTAPEVAGPASGGRDIPGEGDAKRVAAVRVDDGRSVTGRRVTGGDDEPRARPDDGGTDAGPAERARDRRAAPVPAAPLGEAELGAKDSAQSSDPSGESPAPRLPALRGPAPRPPALGAPAQRAPALRAPLPGGGRHRAPANGSPILE